MNYWSAFGALSVLAIGKRLSLLLAAVAVYSVIAELLVRTLHLQVPDWGNAASLINTIILSLLMGFRNRAAYERWWEARGLWGQLTNDSRNLAAKIAAFVPTAAMSSARVGEAIAGFAVALKRQLRGEQSRLQEIAGFEHETESPSHVPLYLAQRLYTAIAAWKRDGIIDGATLWVLDPHARGLLDVCGGCEKIRGTPLSPSYRALFRAGLVVNVLAGPWLTGPEIGFWVVPVLQLMCFFLLGVELIDSVVEEPFGRERDDLDLDAYCRTIHDGVAASLPMKRPQ